MVAECSPISPHRPASQPESFFKAKLSMVGVLGTGSDKSRRVPIILVEEGRDDCRQQVRSDSL